MRLILLGLESSPGIGARIRPTVACRDGRAPPFFGQSTPSLQCGIRRGLRYPVAEIKGAEGMVATKSVPLRRQRVPVGHLPKFLGLHQLSLRSVAEPLDGVFHRM